ncbi:MAG TPA: cytochrome P450 [Pyrinomonadaceae bacterium]|nr:cytochrome P450 [Pyrinomonadaceae bacterium]
MNQNNADIAVNNVAPAAAASAAAAVFAADARPPALENPRHRLISIRISPMVEMARWIFELYNIPYAEEKHVAGLHLLATRRAGGGDEVPVVVTAEGVWKGAREFLINFDAKTPPGNRLLGENDSHRAENLALADSLFALLLKQVRRYVYFYLLPEKRLLKPVVTDGVPLWEKLFVDLFYPLWQRLMSKGLDFSGSLVGDAKSDVEQAFKMVEERLGDGRRFLAGERPGIADIVFSSLAAPVVFPPQYGAKVPEMSELPMELRDFVSRCRASRAGQLVLDTYAERRTESQPPMDYKKRTVGLGNLIFGPAVKVWIARLLVRHAPRLIVGGFAVVSRWDDVKDVFARDTEFLIAPLNAPPIEEINGPFVLGMDRSELMLREQRQMYAGLSAVDFPAVRAQVRAEAERLLAAARESGDGKIEVVNGYARLVAARTAVSVFGVSGSSEADYMRVVRRIFHHAFLNIGADAEIRNQALAASADLRRWTLEEIARRLSTGERRNDVMSALLALRDTDPEALDDDGVRRTLMGMLVGAVDTTATAVANCTAVLLSSEDLKKRALRDADNPDRFVGWCWEALRFMPHNSVLARFAHTGTKIRDKQLKRDTKVVINILGAMHDAEVFSSPEEINPERPLANYFHFGGGLHPCAGRAINAVQVPELVRLLLLHNASSAERPRFDGPFIDEMVVQL